MKRLFAVLLFVYAAQFAAAQNLPKPEREFRAVWIATVDNIDFPSKKNLPVEQQKAEMIRILDTARSLNFNCVIFQVRPMADALYDSKIEPWSEFLTGEMGKSPTQKFDPLAFTVAEAHKRGILVHAWFNPFRAFHPAAKTVAANHISKTRPDLVREYGKYFWLDPTEPEVQQLSLKVVLDVVRRYDVDGVHFDDYFYPYPEKDLAGNRIEFPDDKNWLAFKNKPRRIVLRDEWRRNQVDGFISRVSTQIKQIKPDVMFGVSPFGIWQPVPEKGIEGFNAYTELYADSLKWLKRGWIDYLAPQLYWETARKGQSFPILLDWWNSQNTAKRHLWAGIAIYRVGSNPNFTAGEIASQIQTTRRVSPETRGTIHFSSKHLLKNTGGISDVLSDKIYQRAALIPKSDWIKTTKLLAPIVKTAKSGGKIKVSWRERGARKAFWVIVYAEDETGWNYSILPAAQTSVSLSANRKIRQIIVRTVDRLGNESPSTAAKL